MTFIKTSYRKWLPWLMVIIALYFANEILNSTEVKRSKHHRSDEKLRVVKVAEIKKSPIKPKWQATGVVIPSEQVNIVAEVSGKIEQLNPAAKPGNFLDKSAWLVKIDQTDYQLNLRNQQAQLIQAQANFDLERVERQLAKEELSLIENIDDSSIEMALVLREPQFKSAQAKLASAQANVEKAQVALTRTQVEMPFKGQIIKRNIGRGSRVGQNSSLFTLVNVETFWLEVKVPRSFLALLNKNEIVTLSQTQIWGEGRTRSAKIISVLPELDSRDRQAKILLAIDDPLNTRVIQDETSNASTGQPPVFINDFVNAELTGVEIEDAWTLKASWLLPDNTVWVIDGQKTMQKRSVNVLFKGPDLVYVAGNFKPGDLALAEKPGVTALGMPVKVKYLESLEAEMAELNKFSDKQLPKTRKKAKRQVNENNNTDSKKRAS
ncbi:MAG: efflux RND transporter periplasmic adaptor subunit [Thalassotalea sp.]